MKKLVIFLLGVLLNFQAFAGEYPPEWWQPIPESEKKSWEILPQEAGEGEVILSKRTELGIFSNFAATGFHLDGDFFASVEALWQMMKYPEHRKDPRNEMEYPFTRDEVKKLVGFEAKEAGKVASENMKKLGIHWVSYQGERLDYMGKDQNRHFEIIKAGIYAKVTGNPDVRRLLLKTRGLKLRPDHYQGENITPAYEYHKILMQIRDNLIANSN